MKSVLAFALILLVAPSIRATSFNDLDSPETDLTSQLPQVGNPDSYVFAFGLPDGQACVIALEGLAVRSHHSSNGGSSFGPGVTVHGSSRVLSLRAILAPDGRLFAAFAAEDPAGGLLLLAARSDDMGLTWTQAVVVADASGPAPNTLTIAMDAAAGSVVVSFVTSYPSYEAWVAASADLGATWRLNRVDNVNGADAWYSSVAIDPATGNIYVTFSQAMIANGDPLLWTSRSLDGGQTFEPPVNRSALLPASAIAFDVSTEVAADGSVIFAVVYTDLTVGDFVDVFRSADHGVNFTSALNWWVGTAFSAIETLPRLHGAAGTSTLFLSYRTPNGARAIHRSTNHGSYFDGQVLLSGPTIRDSSRFAEPIVRTAPGHWAIVWEDTRFTDPFRGSDIFVRTSADDGATWASEQRASTPSWRRAEQVAYPAIAAIGSDGILVAHAHTPATNLEAVDVFAAVSSFGSPAFGPDVRIDDDADTVATGVSNDIAVVGDGERHVYSAFTTTSGVSLYVTASSDKGETFAAPVLVSTGERKKLHALASTSDGHVYLVYSINSLLMFARSADYGVTWPTVNSTIGYGVTRFADLRALPGGRLYVVWSDNNDVYVARSSDGGASMVIADVDENDTSADTDPKVCVEGHRVILVWLGRRTGSTATTVLVRTSSDDGQSFSPVTDLRPSGSSLNVLASPRLACDGNVAALAIWRESSATQLRRSRFDGTTWSPAATIATPPGSVTEPLPAFVDGAGGTAVISFAGGINGSYAYAMRSTNGGLDFGAAVQLDLTAPWPAAESRFPRLASDQRGHIWVTWLDRGDLGNWSLALTRSIDGGLSYEPVVRVNREIPQGALLNYHNTYPLPVAVTVPSALPGIGLFAWVGQRESSLTDALFNRDVVDGDVDGSLRTDDCDDNDPTVYPGAPQLCDGKNNDCDSTGWPVLPAEELDPDGDGRITCDDCAPANGDIWQLPDEVPTLTLESGPGTRLIWTAAGPAHRYDVAGGNLEDLRIGLGTDGASCLADDLPSADWTDPRPEPATDFGYYYFVRAQNVCGSGPYGVDSSGAQRTAPAACP